MTKALRVPQKQKSKQITAQDEDPVHTFPYVSLNCETERLRTHLGSFMTCDGGAKLRPSLTTAHVAFSSSTSTLTALRMAIASSLASVLRRLQRRSTFPAADLGMRAREMNESCGTSKPTSSSRALKMICSCSGLSASEEVTAWLSAS
eukprot:scaffold214_cov249-Pinguiococcus_pyrenoidosus.AAC.4